MECFFGFDMPIRHERAALLGIDSILDILGISRCRDEDSGSIGTNVFADVQTTCHGDIYDTRKYRCFTVPTSNCFDMLLHLMLLEHHRWQKLHAANSIWKLLIRQPANESSRAILRSTTRKFNLVTAITRCVDARKERAQLVASDLRYSYIGILPCLGNRE